jgi:hypothetical protein
MGGFGPKALEIFKIKLIWPVLVSEYYRDIHAQSRSKLSNTLQMFTPPCSIDEHVIHDRLLYDAKCRGTFTVDMWHPVTSCTGIKCPWHPLFTSIDEVNDYNLFMISWSELNELAFAEDLARETEVERVERELRDAELAEQERIQAEVIRQELYARDLAFRQSLKAPRPIRGVAPPPKKLILAPCKWIYAIDGKDGCFSHKPCSECWGHEYTNAKGQFNAPHKCEYIHPNQPEWKAEWMALPLTRDRWHAPAAPKSENRFENFVQKGSSKRDRPVGPREY